VGGRGREFLLLIWLELLALMLWRNILCTLQEVGRDGKAKTGEVFKVVVLVLMTDGWLLVAGCRLLSLQAVARTRWAPLTLT
jgi:hypothetical protein